MNENRILVSTPRKKSIWAVFKIYSNNYCRNSYGKRLGKTNVSMWLINKILKIAIRFSNLLVMKLTYRITSCCKISSSKLLQTNQNITREEISLLFILLKTLKTIRFLASKLFKEMMP